MSPDIELPQKLFIPGWGAAPALYRSGMAAGWHVLELPTFRAGRGELGPYSRCLREAIASRSGRVTLAGHSIGALALLAAAGSWSASPGCSCSRPQGCRSSSPCAAAR